MSGTFYTADLHLGHRLVAGLRGFDTTTEHDAAIMDVLLLDTRPGDQVWILGDISIGSRQASDYALGLLAKLSDTGRVLHLVSGNHDATSPLHRDAHRHQVDFFRVFSSVSHVVRRNVDGESVWLSHFPFHGAGDRAGRVERGQAIRVHDDGSTILLHGHLHGDTPVTGPRSVDVGLDAHGLRPWHEADLTELVRELRNR